MCVCVCVCVYLLAIRFMIRTYGDDITLGKKRKIKREKTKNTHSAKYSLCVVLASFVLISPAMTSTYNFDDLKLMDIPTNVVDKEVPELCKIMYSNEYIHKMRLFNTLLKSKEYSERSLYITGEIINLIPAYYTAWNFRFQILQHIIENITENWQTNNEDTFQDVKSCIVSKLNDELDLLDEFTLNNPKNYQIWSYRQAILSKLHPNPSFQRETPIIQMMLDDDTKNHHVWSYRKWCCKFFFFSQENKKEIKNTILNLSNEWAFVDAFVERDIYNNSAWCHRNYILQQLQTNDNKANHLLEIQSEIQYTKEKIDLAPHNISPWAYLKFLYEYENKYENGYSASHLNKYEDSKKQEIIEFIKIYQETTSFSLEYLAHFYTLFDSVLYHAEIIKLYTLLIEKYDPIRKNYWKHKIKTLQSV